MPCSAGRRHRASWAGLYGPRRTDRRTLRGAPRESGIRRRARARRRGARQDPAGHRPPPIRPHLGEAAQTHLEGTPTVEWGDDDDRRGAPGDRQLQSSSPASGSPLAASSRRPQTSLDEAGLGRAGQSVRSCAEAGGRPDPRASSATGDRKEVAEHSARCCTSAGPRTTRRDHADRLRVDLDAVQDPVRAAERVVQRDSRGNDRRRHSPPGSRWASATSLIARPRAAAPATGAWLTPVIPGAPAHAVPRVPPTVGGRRTIASGSTQTPNARRMRMTSLLTASAPSTSADGSASG